MREGDKYIIPYVFTKAGDEGAAGPVKVLWAEKRFNLPSQTGATLQ